MPEKTLRDKIADVICEDKRYEHIEAYLLTGQIIAVLPEQPKGMSEDDIEKIIAAEVFTRGDEVICGINDAAKRLSGKIAKPVQPNGIDNDGNPIQYGVNNGTPEEKTCGNCNFSCPVDACAMWKKKEAVELPEGFKLTEGYPQSAVLEVINAILRYLKSKEGVR